MAELCREVAHKKITDVATRESRAKGARAANAARTAKREERQAEAGKRFDALVEKAVDKLAALLDSEDDAVAMRAAREVFDRVLGRSAQTHEHSGRVELGVEVAQVRERLDTRLADRASRRRP